MAIDRIAMMTVEKPSLEWFHYMNAELAKPQDERHFLFVFTRQEATDTIDHESSVAVCTKPGISPFVRVEINFKVGGSKEPPSTRVETNPNNFESGYRGLCLLVEATFGYEPPDLRVTRLDLNADIEDVTVEYFRSTLRMPRKRKSGDVGDWRSRGVETFYIGKSPARLRTYDKVQEQKYRNADVSTLPAILTRIEWELHGVSILKCAGFPAWYGTHRPAALAPQIGFDKAKTQAFFFSELPMLEECRPFQQLEFIEGKPYYDFRTDSAVMESVRGLAYEALVARLGAHDAVRVLNSQRNFARDYKPLLLNNGKLRERIEEAYTSSIVRFFDNKGTSVHHIYGSATN